MRIKRSILPYFIIVYLCSPCEVDIREKYISGSEYMQPNRLLGLGTENATVIDEKISYLKRIGTIGNNVSEDKPRFMDISDICIDDDDNVYVADSKLHKILKFSRRQEYILSFGRGGQGPGEMMGKLGISYGNDGNIYVSDYARYRYIKYNKSGNYLEEYHLPKVTNDVVLVNSLGNRYLISENGYNIIDCYDKSNRYVESLLDITFNMVFPLEQLPQNKLRLLKRSHINSRQIKRAISKDDHLIVILNLSLQAFVFDISNNLCYQFPIDEPRILSDLRARLNNATKMGGWILPFGSVYLDNKNNIDICYFNESENIAEIIRYRISGEYVDILRIDGLSNNSNRAILACDSAGRFYGIDKEDQKVLIYEAPNSGTPKKAY